MPAFVVVQIEVTDPERYEDYKKRVPPTVEAYGGRFLVRGGATETLEGDWRPGRLVILEFPSRERARAWWSSEAYRLPKEIRRSASRSHLLIADGF